MDINFPPEAVVKQTPKLYYKKYPFRVEVQTRYSYGHSYYQKSVKALKNLTSRFTKQELVGIRTLDNWYSKAFYCQNVDDVNKVLGLLNNYDPKVVKLTINVMKEEQVEANKLDAKLVFRTSLFFKKYMWRLSFTGATSDVFDSLQAQFFTDEENAEFNSFAENNLKFIWPGDQVDHRICESQSNERVKISYGRSRANTTIYCVDENDATLAKLMIPAQVSVQKVVLSDVTGLK